ncbi:MAG: Arc family DNA-binding protein [Pseudoalteromonas sp.]
MSNKLQFKVRLDESLHGKIKSAADKNNQSVNAEIVTRLESSLYEENEGKLKNDEITKRLREYQKEHLSNAATLFESLTEQVKGVVSKADTLHRYILPAICQSSSIRLNSSGTTHGDKEQLAAFAVSFPQSKRVLIAVRDGNSNYSALTAVFYSENYTFIADQTVMTVERSPREREVFELFQDLDERGLLDVAEFAVTRVKQTRDLPVDQAIEELEQYETKPVRSNIYEFLSLFFREPEQVKPDWFVDEWKKLN